MLIMAVYPVKDTIFWKPINSHVLLTWIFDWLFIKSKIQFFESKSQHHALNPYDCRCCLSSQRYNFLKANHNDCFRNVVYNELFIKSKIQFFESKSQRVAKLSGYENSCLSSQRYNFLKANHNGIQTPIYSDHAVYQVKDTFFFFLPSTNFVY